MLNPVYSTQFKKDLKKYQKSGRRDTQKIKDIILKLISEEKLPPKNRDHDLGGKFIGRRECHIEPDWLLIYFIAGNDIIFERTGSHSELFS